MHDEQHCLVGRREHGPARSRPCSFRFDDQGGHDRNAAASATDDYRIQIYFGDQALKLVRHNRYARHQLIQRSRIPGRPAAHTGQGVSVAILGNGANAWFGWPTVPAVEEMRGKFLTAQTDAQRKEIADKLQDVMLDEGVVVPLGQINAVAAYRNTLKGVLEAPAPVFWNISKTGK